MKKGSRNARRRFWNPFCLFMLLRKALHHLVQLSADGGGGGDLYLAAKAAYPAKN